MPELMPGAQPSANPAQREEFQQRCRQLHRDDVTEACEYAATVSVATGARATTSDLEAMFPALDPALVRLLHSEAPTPQHAIETLLALSASMATPVVGGQAPRATTPPPRNLGVEDHGKFPSLVDSGGWQLVTQRQIEQDAEEDRGSAWRDRAKAAVDIPAPRPAPSAAAVAWGQKKRQGPKKEEHYEPQQYLTDYEFRHRAGERRAQHRVQYGRGGRATAAGRGGRAMGMGGAGAGATAGGSEDEEASQEEET